jgi:transposase
MDTNSLMKFSDQLTDEEYLLFDYMAYQGCTITEAANKIEFSLSKTYKLLGAIKCKGMLFFTSNQNIFSSKDRNINLSGTYTNALHADIQNAPEKFAVSA